MKLGVFAVLYGNRPLKDVLTKLKTMGCQAVEIGAGGYPGKGHCDPKALLADPAALAVFQKTLADSGLAVSALSVHGNPVHPDAATAKAFHDDFADACVLAGKIGVDTVITFSGCPGDHAGAKYPNWVTCPWPGDFLEILKYQWDDVLIPYWKKAAAHAKANGVTKIALEMHPGFCVYNPESLLKLRAAVGDTIGANFDPSHLVWQGMDIPAALRVLHGAIHHFHAKDVRVDPYNVAKCGVLDVKHYGDELNRSWVFRTVGYGHGEEWWRTVFSELQLAGYDGAVSIEHEDSLMTLDEGLEKSIAFLKGVILNDAKPGKMHWA
jgi:sugar phosphate isomerase/epimerase